RWLNCFRHSGTGLLVRGNSIKVDFGGLSLMDEVLSRKLSMSSPSGMTFPADRSGRAFWIMVCDRNEGQVLGLSLLATAQAWVCRGFRQLSKSKTWGMDG